MRLHLFVLFVKCPKHGYHGLVGEAECRSKDFSWLARADTELCCTIREKKTLNSDENRIMPLRSISWGRCVLQIRG